jgi:drug/metabolite transporter (DMT)-like permease
VATIIMDTTFRKGVFFAFVTAMISGASIFVNKFAVDAIKPAILFTTVKNIAVGFVLVALLIVFKKWRLFYSLSKINIVRLIFIAIIGGSIPFYLFFTGLSMTPAINAAIIQKTLVFWVALFALPFLKERLSSLQIVGILLLFWGNIFIGGFKGFSYSLGEMYILLATVFWGIEHVIAKRVLAEVDPDIVTAARMGLGSLLLFGIGLITAPQAMTQGITLTFMQFFWLSLTIVFLLGYVMSWYRALAYAPATLVSSILVVATLVTNVLSAVFITHTWNIDMFYQMVIMSVGVSLFLWAAFKKVQKPELAV